MASRHFFWRCPDGRAYRGIDDKHVPTAALSKYGRSWTTNAEGVMMSNSMGLQEVWTITSHAVVFDEDGDEFNESDVMSLVDACLREQIKKTGGGKPISPNAFREAADRMVSRVLRAPLVEYILATSLSVSELPCRTIRIKGCKITTKKTSSKRLCMPKVLAEPAGRSLFQKHLEPTRYLPIEVRVKARTPQQAAALHSKRSIC